MSHMHAEIHEQPEWVARALQSEQEGVRKLVQSMRDRDVRFVVIVARGTSDNAGTYAKYLFEITMGLPCSLAAPSVQTLYDAKLKLDNTLVLGISQSGQGTDVVEVLKESGESGAVTACITNSPDSPITQVCDHVLLCHAGVEQAVAATKTYTTALAVVALIAAEYSGEPRLQSGLGSIANAMQKTLELDAPIARSVERYRYMQECAVLARGINQATALEAALKMTETSYVVARPFSGADFLHGPIAMVDDGFPCFLYGPAGKSHQSNRELVQAIIDRDGEIIAITDAPDLLNAAATPLEMPASVDELLSPLTYAIPGQLFAYHLATTRGYDPDNPRGLRKVTLTR